MKVRVTMLPLTGVALVHMSAVAVFMAVVALILPSTGQRLLAPQADRSSNVNSRSGRRRTILVAAS